MNAPSARALAMVGEAITFDSDRRGEVRGVITAAESVPSLIQHPDGRWSPSVRFRIKPDDGSRAFWTSSFPDEDVVS